MATSVVDPETLAMLRELQADGAGDLLGELIDLFLDDVPGRLVGMDEAIGKGDGEVLQGLAHSLKGSSGNLGASEMAALCACLEKCGRDRSLDEAEAIYVELVREFHLVRAALELERHRTDAAATA